MEQFLFHQESGCGWRKDEARSLVRVSVVCSVQCFDTVGWLKEKGKEEYLYSAFLHQGTHKVLRHGSHSFTCKHHHVCLSFVVFTRCHHHSN